MDAIYCAGDYVDYGTDPHEAIGWVREHGAHCVMGNHDRHLLNILFSGEVDAFRGTNRYKWVHDNCERVTDEDIRLSGRAAAALAPALKRMVYSVPDAAPNAG